MSVRHALLALLSEGPKYGLQLRQEFEARTGEVWPLNVGQVYTTLQRLERDGLVASDGDGDDGPQRNFRITPRGEAERPPANWVTVRVTDTSGAASWLSTALTCVTYRATAIRGVWCEPPQPASSSAGRATAAASGATAPAARLT